MTMTSVTDFYKTYRDSLSRLDKPACVQLVLDVLAQGDLPLVTVYQDVLAQTLNELSDEELGQPGAIWREHVRSEITRTVVECCYPTVEKQSAEQIRSLTAAGSGQFSRKRVMIALPAEEYHELGARMGADFFQLAGFETLFVGANTPQESILQGIGWYQPDFVDIHVVNYYNLFKARELIAKIRRKYPAVRLLSSGRAFRGEAGHLDEFGPVCLIQSLQDIQALLEVSP